MKLESSPLFTILSNPDSVHSYFGWPTVARLKDGRLAAGVSGFRLWHVCPFGKSVVTFSEDEGETWSPATVVFDTLLDDRDTGLCPFGESGLAVTCFNNGAASLHKYAANFDCSPALKEYIEAYLKVLDAQPDPEKYAGSLLRLSYDNGRSFGPIRIVPVTSPHGPVELPDGALLYVGNPHAYRGGVHGHSAYVLQCWRIEPEGGQTLLGEIPAPPDGHTAEEPHAVLLPDGKILVHIRIEHGGVSSNGDFFTVYQSESEDGGHTFSVPHPIGVDELGGSPPHLLYRDGLLISTYARRAEPHQLRAAFSRDGGKTWDCDNVITPLPDPHADLGYASTVSLKDGGFLTVYYGGDPSLPNISYYPGDGVVYEYPTPVLRGVKWRIAGD